MKKLLLLLLISITGFAAKSQCNIEVTFDSNGNWGDEFSWQLLDASSNVVLSGGPYGGPGWSDVQSLTGTPPYTFNVDGTTLGFFCDNNATYSVTVGGTVATSGTLVPCADLSVPINTVCPACPSPSGLNAVVTLPSTVDLSWSTVGAASFYSLEYRVVGAATWTMFAGNPVAGTTANITGLSSNDYEWRVQSVCGGPTSTFSTGTFTTIPYPGTCATAIAVGPGTYTAPGPASGGGAQNLCFSFGFNANWYAYTASITGTATVNSDLLSNSGGDTYVSVYGGTCGSLSCIADNDDVGFDFYSAVSFPVCAGTTYYIEWDDSWDAGGFDFEITETAGCADPSFPTSGTFTLDGVSGTSWNAGGGGCGGTYEWEVVLSGDAAFAGNDIQSGTGTYPVLFDITGLMSSTDYDLVFRDNCGGGSFSNVVVAPFTTLSPPPADDECVDAIVVNSGYTVTGFTTVGATGTDITSCTLNDVASVWFEYTPTCNDTVQINTCGSTYDTNISIFDACSGGTELACNDDAAAGACSGTLQSYVRFGVSAGVTYYIRVAGFNGSVGDINFSILEETGCPCTVNVWTGANSTDWADPLNWSCGVVPTNACGGGSDNAIIPAGSSVIPVVSTAQGVGNLQIATGASIILNADLDVCGDVVHSGTPLSGGGAMWLMGSVLQNISGNGTFENLFLNNAAGASVGASANIKVSNSLVVAVGTFTNNGAVSLLSNASGTAHLNDMLAGNYSGNITVQRYITPGSGLGQRFFGSAVASSPVTGLDGTYASGYPLGQIIPLACDPNALDASSPYSNLFEWNENASFPTSCYQEGWFAIAPSSSLTPGRGYSGWMNDGSVLSVTGSPNTGPLAFGATSVTPSGVANAQGWHLLANPYPTPLDAQSALDDGFTSLQYYNGASAPFSGTFQPLLASPTGLTLPIMQGFVAQTGGNPFTPDDSYRLVGNVSEFYKSNNWFDYKLDVEVSSNGLADITYLFYSDLNSTQFDPQSDCIKRHSDAGKITLYTKMNNDDLSLNGLHLNDLGQSIPMGIIVPTQGSYTYNFDGMATFPANTDIYVEDILLGVYHNVVDGPYTFDADPAQNGTERFMIHFVLPANFNLIEPSCEDDQAYLLENSNDGRNFQISNDGVVEHTGILDGNANVLSFGDYEVEVFDNFGGSQIYVFVIEEVEAVTAQIISSNTIIEEGEFVDFEFNGSGANQYEWFVNGQLLAQTEMFNYQFIVPGTYEVELHASNNLCDADATQTIVVNEKSTAIINVNGKGSIDVYGNENADIVLVSSQLSVSDIEVKVYNLLGQELVKESFNANGKHVILNNNWANGYYIVKIQIGEESFTQKLMLSKQ